MFAVAIGDRYNIGQIPVARSRSPGDVATDTEQLLAVTLIERIAVVVVVVEV